jgi:hypothetical protein
MGPDQRIADYIRANREQYTREAITQRLMEAGYTREAIDATWSALDAPQPDDRAGEGFWRRFFFIVVGINVGVLVLVGLATGSFFAPDRLGLLGVLAVVLAIGALIAWGIVAAVGPTRLGRTTATVIGVVVVSIFALLIGGSCYAILGSLGPPPRSGTMDVRLGAPLNIEESAEAQCQTATQASLGWSVYATFEGSSGGPVYVNVNAYPEGPGAAPTPLVSIYVEPNSETDPSGLSWSNEFDPESPVSFDVADDGLSGSVTFEALPASAFEAPPGEPTPEEPLSGEISWTCEPDR